MKLEQLQDMIDADSEIDEARLDFESLRIPSLHSKYYRLYMDEVMVLKQRMQEYASLRKAKTEYYLGRGPDQEYIRRPLDIKVLKTDLDLYMAADDELQAMDRRVTLQKSKTEMLEKFVASLKERGFALKTALDFRKFQSGAY